MRSSEPLRQLLLESNAILDAEMAERINFFGMGEE